jgi:preprotein translocase subunit SecD
MKNLISLISLVVFFSTGTASAAETLYFRRVVDDKKIYDQHPQNFEVVVFKDRRGSYESYIERKPSFEIDTAEIKSVTIDKTSVHGNDKGGSYKATFFLNTKAGKSFNEFAGKRDQESFAVILGKNRLSTAQFVGPFDAGTTNYQFTVWLDETNPDRLKQIFGPLENKVTWK